MCLSICDVVLYKIQKPLQIYYVDNITVGAIDIPVDIESRYHPTFLAKRDFSMRYSGRSRRGLLEMRARVWVIIAVLTSLILRSKAKD